MEKNNYYLDVKHLEVNQEGRGKKIHPLMALAVSAALGGLFVVFLPFIGLYLFFKQMAVLAIRPIKGLYHVSITPVAEPGMSYMTGAKPGESKAAESALEELSKEIQERRNQ